MIYEYLTGIFVVAAIVMILLAVFLADDIKRKNKKMRDIQNDLFEVKEHYCESCKFNVLGETWCSKYEKGKPFEVMTGKSACEFYSPLINKIVGALIGFAVGDALGVPVEFVSRDELKINPVKTLNGFGTHNQPVGTWSDDTSLTIALIKGLREKEFNLDSIANKMVEWLDYSKYTAGGVVFDVGNTTRKAIGKIKKGVPPVYAGGQGKFDNGNGSLMRILPLAFYLCNEDDFEKRKAIIYDVSSITHGHVISKVACHFFIEWIIEVIKENDLEAAYETVCNSFKNYYKEKSICKKFNRIFSGEILYLPISQIKSSGYVIDTLEAVIWSVFHTTSFKDAVLTAVNLGDDTDTVGALTGGVAGLVYGWDSIPKEWETKIVNRIIIYNAANELYKKINPDIYNENGK